MISSIQVCWRKLCMLFSSILCTIPARPLSYPLIIVNTATHRNKNISRSSCNLTLVVYLLLSALWSQALSIYVFCQPLFTCTALIKHRNIKGNEHLKEQQNVSYIHFPSSSVADTNIKLILTVGQSFRLQSLYLNTRKCWFFIEVVAFRLVVRKRRSLRTSALNNSLCSVLFYS
jgi:hypothetical protein